MNVVAIGKLFNKSGNRLVSKNIETGRKALKKLNAPYSTRSAEIVKVEKELGQKSSEIISFRNKDNFLISRHRKELENGKEIWHSDTEYCIGKSNLKNKNYALSLVNKQKTKYNPLNEPLEHSRYSTDCAKFTDGKTTRSQLKYKGIPTNNGNLDETFSITEQVNGKLNKFIEGTLTRSPKNEQLHLSLDTSGNIPAKVLRDPYLVMRTMPSELSVKYLKETFSKKFNLDPDKINLFFIQGADKNFVQGLALDHERLGIAVFNNLGINIDTMAHELRHFKQYEYSNKFWTLLKNKILNPKSVNEKEFALAKRFKFKTIFTNPFPNNTSYIEKDAWKVGTRFNTEYLNHTKNFKEVFPYFSKQTVGTLPLEAYL